MKRPLAFLAVSLLALAGAPPAAAAPPELLNKSIRVSYTVTIPGRGDDGSTVPGVRNTSRTVFISSAGRIFARVDRVDGGKLYARKEAAPGEQTNTYRFNGRKLIGVAPFVSGAGQMAVDFDSAGRSCTASLVMGRDTGRALRWKGVNGITYTATAAPTISNVSCAISEGNAFAGRN